MTDHNNQHPFAMTKEQERYFTQKHLGGGQALPRPSGSKPDYQKTNERKPMSNETAKCNDQPASERSCPDPAGSISWQRWDKTVTYKWTHGPYSITNESGYWKLRFQNNLLFGDQDLQVVQEWAASYIKSNNEDRRSSAESGNDL